MADVKVSGLPSDSALDNNHYVPVNDPTGPTTKRTLLSTLAAFFFTQANIPTGDGSPITRASETFYHFAFSGLVWSADSLNSTRNGSMTSGIYYCNGLRLSLAAVAARSFTASKDTYIIADDAGAITYTEVANAGTPPTLASNQMFLGMVVTSAGAITTVYQTSPRRPDEIARVKLTQGTSDLLSANFLPKRTLRATLNGVRSGSTSHKLRFNNDSAANYAFRYEADGVFGVGTSSTGFSSWAGSFEGTLDITNETAVQKIGQFRVIANNNVEAVTTATSNVEFFIKWNNTSTQINRIDLDQTGGGADLAAGTEIIVYGRD